MQFLQFRMGTVDYAVNILEVSSIERPTELSKVPYPAEFVKGLTSIREDIMPVFDLSKKLGTASTSDEVYYMIVHDDQSNTNVAIEIFDVRQILNIPEEQLDDMPSSFLQNQNYIAKAVNLEEGLVMILDVKNLLKDQPIRISSNTETEDETQQAKLAMG